MKKQMLPLLAVDESKGSSGHLFCFVFMVSVLGPLRMSGLVTILTGAKIF